MTRILDPPVGHEVIGLSLKQGLTSLLENNTVRPEKGLLATETVRFLNLENEYSSGPFVMEQHKKS